MLFLHLTTKEDRTRSDLGKVWNLTRRDVLIGPRRQVMADAQKMKKLIWDCQKDIAAYLPPTSGISEDELLQMLISRLDGSQAREALGDDWQGWWPDDDGGDGGDRPLPQQPLPEPA
jgi:hypothetical protein